MRPGAELPGGWATGIFDTLAQQRALPRAAFVHVLIWISSEPVLEKERIVAVGLLTQHDLNLLGHSFTRLWPVEEARGFEPLIEAIDEAERELEQAKDQSR